MEDTEVHSFLSDSLQICSLSSLKLFSGQFLVDQTLEVTKNGSERMQCACLGWSVRSKTDSAANNARLLPAQMLFAINEILRKLGDFT